MNPASAPKPSPSARLCVSRGAIWASWLRRHPVTLVPLAITVGALTGLGAVGFRWLITTFTRVDTDRGVMIGWVTYEAVLNRVHPAIADTVEETHSLGLLRRRESK